MMRNSIACVTCRSAKRQCIHNNRPPCERCKATGRVETCYFPAPGTSALHRQPKQLRRASQKRSPSSILSNHLELDGVGSVTSDVAKLLRPPDFHLSQVNPFDLFTDEVKNSYLRCAYKWSFHHIPTLLVKIRNRTLEQHVVWAMLALAIRFSNQPPAPFSSTIEASNAYAVHAKDVLPNLETPSLDRIQALLMITGHSWGAGEGSRAWLHLGMAVRMAGVMGLFEERHHPYNQPLKSEDFVLEEERRRTAWTCFLMESLLSGGKGRKRTIAADDMNIQLPCERDRFAFGEPVRCERLNGTIPMDHPMLPIGELGIIAHSMRCADIWGAVARWACSSVVNSELPWAAESQFQQLLTRLEAWRSALPYRLQYNLGSLQAHTATDQGQAYCYMHAIYFMAVMFLHRSYLPVLGLGKEQPMAANQQYYAAQWEEWRRHSRKELFKTAAQVSDMLEEMRTFGVYFLRGCVPWIGFTIYTAVGVMLYCHNYSSLEDDDDVVNRARERATNGCAFLKDMQGQWPMASTWFKTCMRMQAYYSNLRKSGEEAVTPDERRELQNAMIDYGALQPDPVKQNPDDPASDTETKTEPQSDTTSPSTSLAFSESPVIDFSPEAEYSGLEMLPEEVEMFDYDWNIDNAELEAMIANATSGFWASFPGEVGLEMPTWN